MFVVKFKYMDTQKIGLAKSKIYCNYSDLIVVKTERGEEIAKTLKTYDYNEEELEKAGVSPKSIYIVKRKATPDDIEKFNNNIPFSRKALKICAQKVKKYELPMKLIDAYTTLNRERIVFYFTSETRVDFRQLVRDLANHFKTRIELRQIGVRDVIKMSGSLGICGKVCCCCEFIECFESVSLTMAKLEGLPLNPSKLSGVCGRLLCCLKFEEPLYSIREHIPEEGETIETPDGSAKLVSVDILRERIVAEFEGGERKTYPLEVVVPKEKINEWKESLKVFKDDRFTCFTRAGVIGGEIEEDIEEFS